MARHFAVAVLALVAACAHFLPARSHGDTGSTGPPCLRNVGVNLKGAYVPGSITVDGLAGDWSSVPGNSFSLYPALTDNAANAYSGGVMQIKVRFYVVDLFLLYSALCENSLFFASFEIVFFDATLVAIISEFGDFSKWKGHFCCCP